MKLKKITIDNFRGFSGRHEFDFEEKALIMLTAPNGNGKTSLLDAIEWCLTGNIKRIQDVYQRRNTNATERKENRSAVLKNENHLTDKTEVILEIKNDTEEYTIRRVQSKDTLEDKGKVYVNQLSGEQAEEKLESMTDLKNFYKYHFCDMCQKHKRRNAFQRRAACVNWLFCHFGDFCGLPDQAHDLAGEDVADQRGPELAVVVGLDLLQGHAVLTGNRCQGLTDFLIGCLQVLQGHDLLHGSLDPDGGHSVGPGVLPELLLGGVQELAVHLQIQALLCQLGRQVLHLLIHLSLDLLLGGSEVQGLGSLLQQTVLQVHLAPLVGVGLHTLG